MVQEEEEEHLMEEDHQRGNSHLLPTMPLGLRAQEEEGALQEDRLAGKVSSLTRPMEILTLEAMPTIWINGPRTLISPSSNRLIGQCP